MNEIEIALLLSFCGLSLFVGYTLDQIDTLKHKVKWLEKQTKGENK